jgi:hypothetical protein
LSRSSAKVVRRITRMNIAIHMNPLAIRGLPTSIGDSDAQSGVNAVRCCPYVALTIARFTLRKLLH